MLDAIERVEVSLLRHGIKHGPHHLDLFYGTPSPGNTKAAERYAANRFSVTRQLRYSRDDTQLALDLGLFIRRGRRPAVQARPRPARELFEFGRCVAHFAVDDHEIRFCTHLKGKASWFLPFNLGWNDGAGNPQRPQDRLPVESDHIYHMTPIWYITIPPNATVATPITALRPL